MRRFASIASGLLACIAACGDDGVHHLADAPPAPDDAPDAPPAATTVNITALARSSETVPAGSPHPGALVFAVDTAGHLAGTATTGADGKATVPLPNGGSVTVVYQLQGPPAFGGPSQSAVVVTYAGVKPGDSLTFGDYATNYSATTGQVGQMTVSWPAVANATRYRLYTPCMSSTYIDTTNVTIDLNESCQTATSPLGLVAYDENNIALASLFLAATPSTPGTALTLTAAQWVTAASYSLAVTNLEAPVISAYLGVFDESVPGELGSFWLSSPPFGQDVPPASGSAMGTFSVASTAARKIAAAKLANDSHDGRHWIYKASASPATIDDAGIPWINSVTVDTALRKVSWEATTGTYDAMTLRAYWNNFEWRVILPPGITQLDATAFPTELAPYLPNPTDGFSLQSCQMIDLSSAASYDALRALPEWRVMTAETAVRRGDEPLAALADCGEGYHF